MDQEYDIIIIGAGVAGLVCGCYLAKWGFKVLIIEKQEKPGGFCTSFSRNDFVFDVGVHYLGSCRQEKGIINKVLTELDLLERLNLIDCDPHDRILTPYEDIYLSKNIATSIKNLSQFFPKERENLRRFYDFVDNTNLMTLFATTKNKTFLDVLKRYTTDEKLMSILSIPIGNLGLSPSKASAFVSIMLYREYVMDGGYYPRGGIQKYPDLLAQRFSEFGGRILFSKPVKSIKVQGREKLVVVEGVDSFTSQCIVANCDATLVFEQLLQIESEEKQKLNKMHISPSAYVIYLGLNRDISLDMKQNLCTWCFDSYDIEKCYAVNENYNLERNLLAGGNVDYSIFHFPTLFDKSLAPDGKSVLRSELWVDTDNIANWKDAKEDIYPKILAKIEKLIPNIEKFVEIKEIATPLTINKWNGTKNGAIFGWMPLLTQGDKNIFNTRTSIKGLYVTGSWAINGIGQCGIPVVTYSGKNAANLVKQDFGNLLN